MPQNTRQDFETQLAALADQFDKHRAEYLRTDYSEAQARLDFVNPFFESLGWDVRNARGLSLREREVVVEQGETTGRPDYNFRLNGRTVFFVEAKAPHVPLDRVDVVMQTKTYAWHSRDVFVAAVTDFEEFRLYDATAKPDRKHPDAGLIFDYRYSDYLKHKTLDDLWLLSREAVAAGSIDKLLKKSSVQARQRIPVDQAFLDDLSTWREQLAKAVFKAQPDLAPTDLNNIVQVFLDRLIFIRICEDRRIMAARQLEEVARNWEFSGKRISITNDLNALFHDVNDRLNGEIFKPHACEKIDWDINAELVADIIKNLYFPASPYLFDKIPVELLGSIYERYLGKTIREVGKRVVIEDKPEVRKAGGVYYTPKYIVDYIVEQTVGKLIEGKPPKQIASLRILDPACGSGSFLIGAYQKLLDHHKHYYTEHARAREATAPQARLIDAEEGGELKLSLEEKAAILRNNIYGVDIDPQAVEITMMSLYIKMLEDERGVLSGRALLPRLHDNIKCGNSLIGYDIGALSGEEKARVNPFDWTSKSEGFGEIMAAGGFDAVIGNPPYVDIKGLPPQEVSYIFEHFSASNNRINLFAAFVEKSLTVIRAGNFRFGMIVPTALLTQDSYKALRLKILDGFHVDAIVRLPNESFGEAAGDVKVDTAIVIIDNPEHSKVKSEVIAYEGYSRISAIDENAATVHGFFDQEDWKLSPDTVWSLNLNTSTRTLLTKCEKAGIPLEKCVEFSLGLTPYDKYKGHTPSQIENQVYHANRKKDRTFKPLLAGNDVRRYSVNWNGEVWISYGDWLGAPRDQRFFTQKRILVKQIIDWTEKRIWASLTSEELYNTQNAFNLLARNDLALEYILGILNSRLMSFYHRKKYLDEFKMRFQKILIKDCKQLPIRAINFDDPADKSRHGRMVALVERMLDLHKQKQAANSDAARERIEREIHVTDEQIDALVYELYGLTKEEIEIVRGRD